MPCILLTNNLQNLIEQNYSTMKVDPSHPTHRCTPTMQTSSWDSYQNGEATDLTVTCQGRKFQVHKFTGTVNDTFGLPDEKPDFIALLFQFIYTGNYSDGEHFDELPAIQTMMETDSVHEEMLTKGPDTIMSMKFDSEELQIYPEDVEEGGSIVPDDDTEDPIFKSEEDADEEPFESDEPLEYDSEYESDRPDGKTDTMEEDDNELEKEEGGEAPSHQDPTTSLQVESMDTCEASDHKGLVTSLQKESKQEASTVSHPKPPLFTSLQMYLLAKKYQIPALRLLAQERFMRSAEVYWTKQDHRVEMDEVEPYHPSYATYATMDWSKPKKPSPWTTLWTNADGFVEVIDDVFTYTELEDPLRRFICNLISHDFSMQADIREKLGPLIEKHKDFAVRMLDSMVRYAGLNEQATRVHFEDAARELRCEPENLQGRFAQIKGTLDRTLRELEDYRSYIYRGQDRLNSISYTSL
ncbi:uncharacterized protein KD926_000799 [Aspergillus affinis]|uniref:uncharacterized protein n=1 Tax=Aspergillus affinis TaxID=1070780 RepID=UPI0022FF10C4|nr:uncharacterized protein KD926_000799 [Aspergillus affinis]KAI9037151.1 hypothetical protein KD926_000799 [Aspergillus affinis]